MFTLGPVTFHLYGLMMVLGILAGAGVASKKDKKIWDSLLWVVGGGIIGARIYHVIDLWGYYQQHLSEIPAVWHGGLGIFGGILGGVIGLGLYARNKQNFLKLLDAGAVGLPLGQAIGRLGNWFNQELYGLPFDSAQGNPPFWSIYIKPENRLLEVMDFEKFHPLFAYEMIWDLIIFITIIKVINNNKIKIGNGEVFLTYLGLYGLGRFFLEFLRIDPWKIGNINVAQVISLVLVGLTLSYWLVKKRR
ncbi:MAG: prolipoprotein diacylglyceryl transferase [Candidatus Beckwithbacteria bacterium]|nr:prolipoprotein diacylglyceryl transferase [Candidatus Beckwithbacteria bacterium]